MSNVYICRPGNEQTCMDVGCLTLEPARPTLINWPLAGLAGSGSSARAMNREIRPTFANTLSLHAGKVSVTPGENCLSVEPNGKCDRHPSFGFL